MTKDACWEFFKAEREVACLRRRIENHVAASKRMGAAWKAGTLHALPGGMFQEEDDTPTINGYLGGELHAKLREFQDAAASLEDKRQRFHDLLS